VSLRLTHRIVWLGSTSVSGGDNVTTFRGKKVKVWTLYSSEIFLRTYRNTRRHKKKKYHTWLSKNRVGDSGLNLPDFRLQSEVRGHSCQRYFMLLKKKITLVREVNYT
jgi:hypothetical protein